MCSLAETSMSGQNVVKGTNHFYAQFCSNAMLTDTPQNRGVGSHVSILLPLSEVRQRVRRGLAADRATTTSCQPPYPPTPCCWSRDSAERILGLSFLFWSGKFSENCPLISQRILWRNVSPNFSVLLLWGFKPLKIFNPKIHAQNCRHSSNPHPPKKKSRIFCLRGGQLLSPRILPHLCVFFLWVAYSVITEPICFWN